MMYSLPLSIELNGKEFKIRKKGDFRMVLDCFNVLNDPELSNREKLIICLIIFYEDIDTMEDLERFPDLEEAVLKMFDFFSCGEKAIGMTTPYKLIDWDSDENIICSAINNVAGKEIRSLRYLHWYTFIGYYLAVGESVLSTIVSIRHKMKKGVKLEKYEQEFRRDNPQYFIWDSRTSAQKQDDEHVKIMWNKER